ncbi:MAG: hypothetical protein MJ231_07690, partial [bacterium]|nr:hypothetical protein [bacterium]
MDIIGKMAALCLLPFVFLYLRSLHTKKRIAWAFFVTFLYATAFIAVICSLYIILGSHWSVHFIRHITEGIEYPSYCPVKTLELLYIFYFYVFRISILIELLGLLGYILFNIIKLSKLSSRTTTDKCFIKIYAWTLTLFVLITGRMIFGLQNLAQIPWLAALTSILIAGTLYSIYVNEL